MLLLLLIGMALVVSGLNYATWKGRKHSRLFLKMMASILFVVIAGYCYDYYGADLRYFIALMVAFLFSLSGDFFLGYDKFTKTGTSASRWFYLGLSSFFIAQIVYAVVFLQHGDFSMWLLLIPLVFLGGIATLMAQPQFKMGRVRFAVLIYAVALGFMMAGCVAVVLRYGFMEQGLLVLVGGALFAVSDFLLVYKYFQTKPPGWVAGMNSVTYYAAQVLFALTIIFF